MIGYQLYIAYPDFELFWTLLSIILVISPEEKDTRRLSIERFKSNFIGSAVAMVLLIFLTPSVYSILLGIFITIVVCRLFNVMNMARVALVALLIIMVQPHEASLVEAPIYRFGSVAVGCIIGLLIVVFTSMIFRPLKRKFGIPY
ncbi:MAG: FUSC family protein [Sphingobacterium composti]|uniref:FUSC family protein n=1 Tax=Sphingobacterium composti TaxID=363260 RepID=UPI001915B1D8|nr:FUSC family protein [Sphingobacterium composti Ten et al. 2007 non Yoo et al. 2007]